MNLTLSANTQAILLLTAPLIVGRGAADSHLLTPGEYKRLARHLREARAQPADLMGGGATEVLQGCAHLILIDRLQILLDRGFLLSQAVEQWHARAIWVISRADHQYPPRLKRRLREDAPILLYGCGDSALLESGGLAVVGSRDVDTALADYATTIGLLCASAGETLISGGAKGIDQAAMRGAIDGGGKVIGVLADSLEKQAVNREHRNMILSNQLTLVSPYDPSVGFNVGHAMQRNKFIYALADAALVVSSDVNKGGTWAGATEQLDKLQLVPVYVRASGEQTVGLGELQKKGALAWTEADTPASVLTAARERVLPVPSDGELPLFAEKSAGRVTVVREGLQPIVVPTVAAASHTPKTPMELAPAPMASELPAERLLATVWEILKCLLVNAMNEADVATALNVSPAQARAWLQHFTNRGLLKKRKKPVMYALQASGLFGDTH